MRAGINKQTLLCVVDGKMPLPPEVAKRNNEDSHGNV